MRNNGAGGVDVMRDVADVVEEGILVNTVDAHREKTPDTTRALEGTGKVFAPNVFYFFRRTVRVINGFKD